MRKTDFPRRRPTGYGLAGGCGRATIEGDARGHFDKERDMTTDHLASLREHLLYLLGGGGAHLDFEKAISGLPAGLRGAKPAGQPHTPWRLLEHLRIAQWDILRFCVDPAHVSPTWTERYWPTGAPPPDEAARDRSGRA